MDYGCGMRMSGVHREKIQITNHRAVKFYTDTNNGCVYRVTDHVLYSNIVLLRYSTSKCKDKVAMLFSHFTSILLLIKMCKNVH